MARHILVFPYPAQGHILALMDLAHQLAAGGLAVTVVVTTKNRPLLDPLLATSPSITPLVLPFPDHPSVPPGIENTKDLPTPINLVPAPISFVHIMQALAGLHDPLLHWARAHPSPPSAIISDMFLGWTQALAAELGVPRLVFSPSGALTLSIINTLWREMPKQTNPDDPNSPIAFPSIPGSPVYPWYQLSLIYRLYKEGEPVWEFLKECFLQNIRSWGYVFNTFEALEGRYVEHMKVDLGHRRVWVVGPLCHADAPNGDRGGTSSVPVGEVLAWLDQFADGSVLYVCFGSQVVLSRPQTEALAAGLQRSGAQFVWSVKGGGWVPEGFEERVAGRGMVIRGWTPQVAVLGHRAVGWFLTHCGWNSTLEAIAAGVAMLTWPLTADQFMNSRLLVEEARVAVRVCEGAGTVPDPDELTRVVVEAMGGSRPETARAAELRRKALLAVKDDGGSCRDLEALVEMVMVLLLVVLLLVVLLLVVFLMVVLLMVLVLLLLMVLLLLLLMVLLMLAVLLMKLLLMLVILLMVLLMKLLLMLVLLLNGLTDGLLDATASYEVQLKELFLS